MKEDYFGDGKLIRRAWEFLEGVEHLRRGRPSPGGAPLEFGGGGTALLVMDMQDYFLDPQSHAFIPSAPAIAPQVRALQEAFAAMGAPVIRTRHLNDTADAGRMADWWRELMTAENPLTRIHPPLEETPATVLIKSQYDAFYNTSLEDMLKEKGVTRVVVTGVMTHLCCETTARSAFVRGFEVFFVADATATYNREFHYSTLVNLAHGFAVPLMTREILDALKD